MCFNFIFTSRQNSTRIFLPSDEGNNQLPRRTQVDIIKEKTRQNTQKFQQLNKIKKINKDDFKIIQMIGQGSNSQVFLVTINDPSFKQNVFSMKQVPKQHLDDKFSKSKDNVLVERSIMTQIQHPLLMPIYFSFQSQQNLYLIMEYMQNIIQLGLVEIYFFINKNPFFLVKKKLDFIYAKLQLQYNHCIVKIQYIDIKLENVMISANGHIKLLDYGLAKPNMKINSEASTICGTPNYLAPEIILQKKYNKSVDWWQLGIIMYEMLANSPPFHDQNRKTLLTNIINVNYQMKPNFSSEAQSLISQLLVADPNKRLGSGVKDAEEIKKHSFFKNVNWEDYENLNIQPPFVPSFTTLTDTSNFDKELVNKIFLSSQQSNPCQDQLENIQGFSYNYQQLSDQP